jgi:class 3 adenylate cyclase
LVNTDLGQRRSAAIRTFLIADIRGYTAFTSREGDESASRLAAKFAELCADAIEAWTGELVELRGDEALAAFDSPRNALRCAIELQDEFAHETDDQPALPLRVGIGLDVGEAVPLAAGYRGTALNVAARLCAIAQAGQTLASGEVIRLSGPIAGLQFGQPEQHQLKGIGRPVDAVLVDPASDHQASFPYQADPVGSRSAAPLPPELDPVVPLAGRRSEMRWLAWHWRRARHGHGRSVVISGPPGIGKTRLAAELAVLAHGEGATVRYLAGGPSVTAADLTDGSSDGATVVVVDDFDALSGSLSHAISEMGTRADRNGDLLLLTHRLEVAQSVRALAERLASAERRLTLQPLPSDAVRQIAALYAGGAIDELPLASHSTSWCASASRSSSRDKRSKTKTPP